MSPLRQRMIGDMTMRKFASKTQQHYIQIIKNLAVFLGRSPDTASFEDIRRFQLHVAASGVGVAVINRTASALRFFFRVTLGRYAIVEHTHFIHEVIGMFMGDLPDALFSFTFIANSSTVGEEASRGRNHP